MNNTNSNRVFLLTLGIISGILMLFSKKLNVFTLLFMICNIILLHSITKDINTSIAIGLIIFNIAISVTNFSYKFYNLEKFNNKDSDNTQNDDSNQDDNSDDNEDDTNNDKSDNTPDDNTDDNIDDTPDNTPDDNNNDNDKDEFIIDSKASFLENYKSLSDKQVAGLNKDTQDLISTQKQLIETLKNMGPALKDGKEILDTFKNYFGNDKQMNDIVSKFKFGK